MTTPIFAAMDDRSNFGNYPGDGPLRPGGQAGSSVEPQGDENLPSTPSEVVKRQQPALMLMRDVIGGTDAVRGKSTLYLPRDPGESSENYQIRLRSSVFFNVTKHTIEGLVGQVFRRDPQFGTDVPQQIQDDWENIDLAGTHGDVFIRDLFRDAESAGHAAILVDFPNTGGMQSSAAEQGPNALRPYWVPICKDEIVSFRTATENGRTVLTQFVREEKTMVPLGAFGEVEQVLYRVFSRTTGPELARPAVGFELLEVTEDKRVIRHDFGSYPTQDEIPIAEIPTSGRKGLFESDPPLEDLANLNVAHYQMWSDYRTSLHKTCVPILTIAGDNPTNPDGTPRALVVGPNTVMRLKDPNAKASYTAHDGNALGSVKQALDDLVSNMGTLGISMLAPSKRTAETAQAKMLDKATEDSALAVSARGLQDGCERAMGFHAKYYRQPSGGSITINKVFDTQRMQADMLTAWSQAVGSAGIPARYMLADMQASELISPDEDVDDIAGEMEANARLAADQARAEAAARLQAQTKTQGAAPGEPGAKVA